MEQKTHVIGGMYELKVYGEFICEAPRKYTWIKGDVSGMSVRDQEYIYHEDLISRGWKFIGIRKENNFDKLYLTLKFNVQ